MRVISHSIIAFGLLASLFTLNKLIKVTVTLMKPEMNIEIVDKSRLIA